MSNVDRSANPEQRVLVPEVSATEIEQTREDLRPSSPVSEKGHEAYEKVNMPTDRVVPVLETIAEERAPDQKSVWRHFVGVTCEFSGALVCRAQMNREIHEDFVGDNGYDFKLPRPNQKSDHRVEVKGTTDWENPTARVSQKEIDNADWFILCRTDAPKARVHVIGAAYRPSVEYLGRDYTQDGYCLRPDYLRSFGGETYTKSEVTELAKDIYNP